MIGNVASLATIIGYGIAGYVWLNPLDAYASELTPWKREGIDPTLGLLILLTLAGLWALAWNISLIRRAADRIEQKRWLDELYADPDKHTHETPEDVWRRAYAESDGDHASYVKWRRK